MSGLAGPETAGTDPIDLPLPSGATRSGTSLDEELEDCILKGTSRSAVGRREHQISVLEPELDGYGDGSQESCLKSCDELRTTSSKVPSSLDRARNKEKAVEKLYTLLVLPCKDEEESHVRTAEDGNGLQAWQALVRAKTLRHFTSFYGTVAGPTLHVEGSEGQFASVGQRTRTNIKHKWLKQCLNNSG